MNLPETISRLVGDQPYYEETIGMSDAKVRMYSDMVMKIEPNSKKAARHAEILRWVHGKLPVPAVLACESVSGTQYLLMERMQGDAACVPYYMERPALQAKLLAEALQMLWQTDISDCPVQRTTDVLLAEAAERVEQFAVDTSDPEIFGQDGFYSPSKLLHWLEANRPEPEPVFSHGDFCLPNILLTGDAISGMIDLGDAGVGDKWYDISMVLRSLSWNYNGRFGGPVYSGLDPNLLFDALGIAPDWDRIRYFELLDAL